MNRLLGISTLFLFLLACGPASHENVSMSDAFGLGGTCEENLVNTYRAKIHPFFRGENHCVKCHIEGGVGLGLFASSDARTSYGAFQAAGVSKIRYMATNPQHKPPFTGVQNQSAVNDWTAVWNKGQTDYLACLSRVGGGGDESMLTAAKSAPGLYASRTAVVTLNWELDLAEDLDESINRSLPARVKIDVKILYQNDDAKGYIFSKPVLQMKDGTKQVLAEGLLLQINRQPISSQTTFANISRVVSGTAPVPLMNGAQASTFIEPISTTDTFQLYYRRLALTSGGEASPAPLTPILRAFDSETGSSLLIKKTTYQTGILRDAGIVRWCLSENPAAPATAEAPCDSNLTGGGTMNGWSLSRPVNFTVPNGDGPRSLYLWVANQDLKLNVTPAKVDFTLDTTAPAAPVLNSITVTDTQVAALSASHGDEGDVTGWCVIEQNAIQNTPGKPDLDDSCWTWTDLGAKPTTVGFKEGGARKVWLFVRDKAGNVSSASNFIQATNPFGAITFSQLTNTAGGPRAIFQNRCYTCHGTSANPGYSQLKLFNFENASEIADAGILVSRINNPVSPMPNVNGGLMPQRERDLIRLWTMPEEGEEPLP